MSQKLCQNFWMTIDFDHRMHLPARWIWICRVNKRMADGIFLWQNIKGISKNLLGVCCVPSIPCGC